MSIATVWFLVVLTIFSDHVSLNRNPVEFSTQKECSSAGISLLIDQRNKNLQLHCVEADDEKDLVVILTKAFDFGGQHI